MKRRASRLAGLLFCASTMAAFGLTAAGVSAATGSERDDRQTQAALALDAHPDQGGREFDRYCAKCHGRGGLGEPTRGRPALAGQRFAYLVRQLANFANAQRDSSTMHAVVSQPQLRSPQTWTDIAAYLNALPPPTATEVGPGTDVALGRGIFREQCAGCHGTDSGGDSDGFVPSLRHQHYSYLNAQMHKLAQGYRHNVDEDLMRFLRSFDDRDMSATADYLSRLKGPGRDRKHMRTDGVVVD